MLLSLFIHVHELLKYLSIKNKYSLVLLLKGANLCRLEKKMLMDVNNFIYFIFSGCNMWRCVCVTVRLWVILIKLWLFSTKLSVVKHWVLMHYINYDYVVLPQKHDKSGYNQTLAICLIIFSSLFYIAKGHIANVVLNIGQKIFASAEKKENFNN